MSVHSQPEELSGTGLGSNLRHSASKAVGPRHGQRLTITETFDDTFVAGVIFTVSAGVAAGLWLRRWRRG